MERRTTSDTREVPDAETAGGLSPGEVFSLLGNEARIDILRVLWEARGGPVGFSELRERVGMTDSGQFNYHLDKLRSHFVRKTEEGYVLRYAGSHVVAAILSGAYDHAGFDEPMPVGDDCQECGAGLVMTYENERATIDCPDCGDHVTSAELPSGVFEDRDPEAIPAVFDRWMQSQIRQVAAGFCMACDGKSVGSVRPDGFEVDVPGLDVDFDGPQVLYECRRCGDRVLASVGEALRDHPAVVAFFYEHGVDVLDAPSWCLDFLDDDATTVVSRDPLRVRLAVSHGGDSLSITVDGDVEVVEVERGA
jgi:DNA-directed RNA polymerase subunit RPC12/RpoP